MNILRRTVNFDLPDHGRDSVQVSSFSVSTEASSVHSESCANEEDCNEALISSLILLLVTVNTGVARVELDSVDSVVAGDSVVDKGSSWSSSTSGIFDP